MKSMITYTVLSAGFSIIGIFIPEKNFLPNPLSNGSLSLFEIGGHILFGFIAGAVSLNLRYFLLAGSFAVLIDSDHIINLFHVEAISRMSHSITFGIVALVVMMLLYGRRDYMLGATAFAGMVSHLAYDSFFSKDPGPPLFTPFYNNTIPFQHSDWLLLEIVAIIIMGCATIVTKKIYEKNL